MSKTLCYFCILILMNGALYELSLVSIFINSPRSQKIPKKTQKTKIFAFFDCVILTNTAIRCVVYIVFFILQVNQVNILPKGKIIRRHRGCKWPKQSLDDDLLRNFIWCLFTDCPIMLINISIMIEFVFIDVETDNIS